MTGLLGAPVPPPPGQWQAALDHAVSATDVDGALDELVPDLWVEHALPASDPSAGSGGTTPDPTVPGPLLPETDAGPDAEGEDPFWTDLSDPENPDDRGDGHGPASW